MINLLSLPAATGAVMNEVIGGMGHTTGTSTDRIL